MSAHTLSWAWKTSGLDVESKIILVKLADQANDDGECWPSLRTICSETGMGRTTAWDRIGKMRDSGLLEIEARERSDGGRTSNRYRLLVDANPPSAQADGGSSPGRTPPIRAGGHREPPLEEALSDESARESLYRALVAACYPVDAVLSDREKRQVALAAGNIASAGGTAALVSVVRARYLAHGSYGKCVLTAQALSSHWAELAPAPGTVPCPSCGLSRGRHLADCAHAEAA